MTRIYPTQTDMALCPSCQSAVLLVGYWNEKAQKACEKMVKPDFQYEFQHRDKNGRLIVEDVEAMNAAGHSLTCPAMGAAFDDGDETKPFQGARGK